MLTEIDDIWSTAATCKKPEWARLASWDDMGVDDINMVDATSTNIQQTVSSSSFLTESCDCIEALYQMRFPDTVVVDQERLFEDVMYLLTGVPSLCFEWNQSESRTKGSFRLRMTRIRLVNVNTETIQQLLQPMIIFGTRMKHLERYIHHIISKPIHPRLVPLRRLLLVVSANLYHTSNTLSCPYSHQQQPVRKINHS
ncbi:hypothetical protein [Absidia glauca]|uniref:Uncharacterized protein n=1 Tax=Absidia glauca TaxID=4829 RepID=A0A168QI46_ABSGL|nr:hypothetical protein [Absidia glauca]